MREFNLRFTLALGLTSILLLMVKMASADLPEQGWYYQDLNCDGVVDSINLDNYNSIPEYLKCGNGKIRVIHFANDKELCVSINSIAAHLDHGDRLPEECPLPVEMGFIELEPDGCNVSINWQTLSEVNNDYFVIQHSYDAYNWKGLYIMNGVGNSNVSIDYSVEMSNLVDGINYFRIMQVDYDGKSEYFDVQSVMVNCITEWDVYEIFDTTGKLLDKGFFEDYEPLPGNTIVRFSKGDQFKVIKQYEIR